MDDVNMLDVGTATGFLSFAAALMNQNHHKLDEFRNIGIDLEKRAIRKALELKNSLEFQKLSNIDFMEDDFFHHFETMNKYNLVVSGCGLLHSDIIGSVYQKSECESELVVISPVFSTDSEQQLRIYHPSAKSDELLEKLDQVALFENLQAAEVSESISSVDLFTCFFSPLEYPEIEVKSDPIHLDMNLEAVGIDLGNPQPQPTDFKKLNLEELTELLNQKETDFKALFIELKKSNPEVSLRDINETENGKELLDDINLLRRYIAAKENI